ncbi:proline--tRNA ligase [Atribacter laminatus]|uniref:Proline--tRNA ligase n=1 Tax=Atribacter laminatus TaxID=2847778 RepID=A0A7T1ANP6_ATRLM|nr:Proline--tRNA ligase [Atribacter laminatus]
MKMSALFAPTLKENPAEAEVISHSLMLRAGMIRQLSSGIYNILPLGLRSLEKIMNIVRRELNHADGQELLLPALQPGELWKETGRWDIYGPELIRFQDRRERDFCLGPTHEEVITDIARKEIRSYRQLPLLLYQIQTKFRDEIRPRFGVMRSREFIMKDLYSFDRDYEGLKVSYQKMYDAYSKIFASCGLEYIAVRADSGVIGGDVSHEFLIIADSGEEKVMRCPKCLVASTQEISDCPECHAGMEEKRGIEVGHIFQLGTKYSESMKAYFVDQDGKEKPLIMGCYGIGIGRTMAAAIEANHDENGIKWPWNIAPYEIIIIPVKLKNQAGMELAESISQQLAHQGYETIWDDREVSAGYKFKEADLIGFPIQVIVGEKALKNGTLEIKIRSNGKRIECTREQLVSVIKKIKDELVIL